MKRMHTRSLLWIAVTLGSALAAFSAGQFQMSRGEIIMNNACVSCHDMRPIQMQAMDRTGWETLIQSMMEKGAEVPMEDLPVLVDYLTLEHGPLPDGSGKPILLDVCTRCHDLHRVREHTGTREEWEDLLVHMIGEGAELTDEDFPVLLNYLSRNFRPVE